MRQPNQKATNLVNESLLGGAAIGISDLLIIESKEIKWSAKADENLLREIKRRSI